MTKPPTLSEMSQALTFDNADDVLEHYGIKGMKWGVRRSRRQLAVASIKKGPDDDDDETVKLVGSGPESRALRKQLKGMKPGEVTVVTLGDGSAPKIMVKNSDGSFKETRISADAERVIKTLKKDPSELSTREMQEATKHAQAVEAYNKLFNPIPNPTSPNAVLKERVEALELQRKYSQVHSELNPSKKTRVVKFVASFAPAFDTYKSADKALNGALSDNMSNVLRELRGLPDSTPGGKHKLGAPKKGKK